MSEQSAEQRVRTVWGDDAIYVDNHTECCGPDNPITVNICGQHFGWHATVSEAWDAALAFTEERLEEVRQLREEIKFMDLIQQFSDWADWHPQARRIVARLESILAEKTAGMRPEVLSEQS